MKNGGSFHSYVSLLWKTFTVCDIENGPVEIVDFPIISMVIFHSLLYVYQRVFIHL